MPWLELCREVVADIRGELKRLPTREEREKVLRRGMGGDETTQIDEAAEQAVVRRLERLDVPGFTLVSEELGERVFGGGGSLRVVLDPIDGSIRSTARSTPSAASPSSRSRSRWRVATRCATSSSATSTTSGAARSGRRGAVRAPG